MIRDKKSRFSVWLHPEIMEQVKKWREDDNCRSQSEFIEKAIEFYCGYVSSEKNTNYLSNIVVSTLKSIVRESDNRTGRLLFKIAVELAMTMNVLASMEEIDDIDLARLRGNCVEEVKRINGMLSFDNAVDWQSGD